MLAELVKSVQVNLSVLTWLLGPGISLLIGIVKRQTLAKHWQVVIAIVVNLLVAFGRQLLAAKGLLDMQLIQDFMGQFLTGAAAYEFLLKPLSTNASFDLTNLFPNFGIGPSVDSDRFGVDDIGDIPLDDGSPAPIAPESDVQPPTSGLI